VSKSDIVLNNSTTTKLDLAKGFVSIPTYLLDELAKTLTPTEWTLYLRLFRLSYGWHKDTCVVGLETLIQSTNIGRTVLRKTLKSLQNRKLIQIVETINTRELKGTKYKIYTLSESDTVSKSDTNKYIDDDHDDYLNKDHHQSEHEKSVMMIYKKITNNYWSKADATNYQKIKNIPLETIEMAIKLATQRAANPPNSLAYFVKEIVNTANPPKQNRNLRRKIMEKIVDIVRNSFVGSSYTMSDFTHKVKDLCIKQDIFFDNDIFNEILAKKK
jgi:hypothetical protein